MSAIAVAGRRIDPEGSQPPRFPIERVQSVREAVCRTLEELHGTSLASSAANGADLIGAECALRRGLPLHIVLPFGPDEFRIRSVDDRPGSWGGLFERVLAAAKATGTLTILAGSPEDDASYLAANTAILDEAERHNSSASALVIWDGRSRGDSDITASFAEEARRRGMPVHHVLTVH